jgi:hypothetical protein
MSVKARGRLLPTILWTASLAGAIVLGWYHLALLAAGTDAGDPSIVSLSVVLVAYASLGWLILARRPGHRVGWLFLATALVMLIVFFGFTFGPALAAIRGRDDVMAGLLIWLGIVLYVPAILLAFPLLALFFPDGHLPGPRWRLPVILVVVGAVTVSLCLGFTAGAFTGAAAHNPLAIPALPGEVTAIGAILAPVVILGGGLLGIAAMVVRFRRGEPDERQQLKWMLAAVLAVLALDAPQELGFASVPLGIAVGLALGLVPAATTLAILRYRLYDIDRLVSRTLAWGLISVLLALVFSGGLILMQAILVGVTQGDTLAVAGTTLVTAFLFQPMRVRIQAIVDRHFNRARLDAQLTVTALTERLRGRVELASVTAALEASASDGLGPSHVATWIRKTSS